MKLHQCRDSQRLGERGANSERRLGRSVIEAEGATTQRRMTCGMSIWREGTAAAVAVVWYTYVVVRAIIKSLGKWGGSKWESEESASLSRCAGRSEK